VPFGKTDDISTVVVTDNASRVEETERLAVANPCGDGEDNRQKARQTNNELLCLKTRHVV